MIRTYSDLCRMGGLEERFDYLSLGGRVGESTFGFDRWINQQFYRSSEWKRARRHILARDEGLDLGAFDSPIFGTPYIHHMNPLTVEDIEDASDNLLDPEFLITTSLRTHNAIHYGDKNLLPRAFVERSPGDTRLWGN